MPTTAEEDLKLIMTCLKYTENRGKPDFGAVATEIGGKPSTLYHRHWSLMKKWGMTGSKASDAGKNVTGNAVGDGDGGRVNHPKTPRTPAKRARKEITTIKRKAQDVTRVADDNDNDSDDSDEASDTFASKKPKVSKAADEI